MGACEEGSPFVQGMRAERLAKVLREGLFLERLLLSRWLVRRAVAATLKVFLEILAFDLDGAPQLYAGYLPALYPPVGPTPTHAQRIADLWDREEHWASGVLTLRSFAREGPFKLKEYLIELFEGLAVGF